MFYCSNICRFSECCSREEEGLCNEDFEEIEPMPFPLAAVLSLISTGLPGLSRGKLLELQVCLLVPVTERLDRHGDEDDASIPTDLPSWVIFF